MFGVLVDTVNAVDTEWSGHAVDAMDAVDAAGHKQ